VGPTFYNSRGLDWDVIGPYEAIFDKISTKSKHNCDYLSISSLELLLKKDVERVFEENKKLVDKNSVFLLPTLKKFKWFWKRTEIESKALFPEILTSYPIGIFHGEEFMVYFFDVKAKSLYSLYSACGKNQNLIIESARVDAQLHGMNNFIIWNAKDIDNHVMESSLPSLAIDGIKDVNWIHNEKYGWV
jgi:hypothetical protein